MKNGWRITAIAATLLILGWLAEAGPAQAGVSSLSIDSGVVVPGESITLSLRAEATIPGIGAYIVEVVYDGSLVDATGCTSTAGACTIDAVAADTVRFAGASVGGLSGDVTLGTITFVAGPTEGTAALTVTVLQLTDPNFNNILLAPGNGSISIVNPAMGDVDCDGDVDAVDSLKVLQYVAGLTVSQTQPCPAIGSGITSLFGDVDCDGDIDAVDALKISQYVAGLPVSQEPGCPAIGS